MVNGGCIAFTSVRVWASGDDSNSTLKKAHSLLKAHGIQVTSAHSDRLAVYHQDTQWPECGIRILIEGCMQEATVEVVCEDTDSVVSRLQEVPSDGCPFYCDIDGADFRPMRRCAKTSGR
jgi:hypothetical protein